jgi:hypothetical protein
MKKTKLLSSLSILCAILFFSSCSHERYAHLKKVKGNPVAIDKILIENKLASLKSVDENTSKLKNEVVPTDNKEICKEEPMVSVNEKTVAPKQKSGSSKIKNSFSAKNALAMVASKIPGKIQSIVRENKNLATHKSASEKSNLLYIVVVVLLILFLLGLLGGGNFGGLIYTLLVIALILLILRFLGVI